LFLDTAVFLFVSRLFSVVRTALRRNISLKHSLKYKVKRGKGKKRKAARQRRRVDFSFFFLSLLTGKRFIMLAEYFHNLFLRTKMKL
jgi:hypothetical protein